jgi:hypothetical protein
MYQRKLDLSSAKKTFLGSMEVAIEAKASERVISDHLKGLRELKNDFPRVRQRIVVCLEKHVRVTEDGIWILPFQEFIRRLWSNPLRSDVSIQLTDVPT